MSDRKPEDNFDSAAVALMIALTKFLIEYRKETPASRQSALRIIHAGLGPFGEALKVIPYDGEVIHINFKDGDDAEDA